MFIYRNVKTCLDLVFFAGKSVLATPLRFRPFYVALSDAEIRNLRAVFKARRAYNLVLSPFP